MNFINYFAALFLAITVSNIFAVKSLRPKPESLRSDFDILVPMRNEEINVDPLLETLINQGGEIYILDDNSTDATLAKLKKFTNQLQLISGKELPDGWLGKNFACHQLAIHGANKYLVFIDADVRLQEGAINSAISQLENSSWDFISPYPKQKTSGVLQFLIQPLLQWSWFATVPFVYANHFPKKSMAVANGQFFIVKRSSYLKSGGHKAIKNEVLDDIELARLLIGAGFKGGPVDGSRIAECHMYKSDSELIGGYSKSLWRAFGSYFGTVIAIVLLGLTAIPFIYFKLAALFIFISRVLVALKVRSSISSSIFHPISMMCLALMIIYSNYLNRIGKLTWKDRNIK